MNNELAKIKLIYEFNPESPLFARVAEAELNEGNTDKALQILEKGLEIYPDYLTAQLVYVEILAKKGEYKRVIEKLDELRPRLNDDEAINHYLEKIEEEKSALSISESLAEEKEDLEENDFESDLENLADTISKAKIPPVDNSKQGNKDYSPKHGNQFISETLAEIYFAQTNFKEALDMYERLLESNPSKSEHFEKKINEIKAAMNK